MPQVVVIVGSDSDLQTVDASRMLEFFEKAGVTYELSVISAHRHSAALKSYCSEMLQSGVQVFIGVAGMAAVLPGIITSDIGAARPVIGVPLASGTLGGQDALFSMVSLPSGVPVGVCGGIGKAGLENAALFACQIVALGNHVVWKSFCQLMVDIRKEKHEQIGIRSKKGGM